MFDKEHWRRTRVHEVRVVFVPTDEAADVASDTGLTEEAFGILTEALKSISDSIEDLFGIFTHEEVTE